MKVGRLGRPGTWLQDEIDELLSERARTEDQLARELGELRPWFWNDLDEWFAPPLEAARND